MSSDESQQRGWGECTLETCSVEWSIFQYQPSLVANAIFITVFGVSMFIHIYQGYRWKQWTFAILVALGCVSEMIGHGGRIIMHNDPWDFNGFMLQISEFFNLRSVEQRLIAAVCISFAPVFMTAAIYITLYKSIMRLSPSSAQFKPALYYQIFIPCDVLCLVFQAVGGAMSTQSDGSSKVGVDLGLVGLSLQVVVVFVFILLSVQYAFRYRKDVRAGKASGEGIDATFKHFVVFISLAIIVIFIRCAYRIYELSDGYSGSALHNQGAFIGCESVMICLAVIFLNIGHPGLVFDPRKNNMAPKAAAKAEPASSSDEEKESAMV